MKNMTNNPSFSCSEQQSQRIMWTVLFLMPIVGMAVDLVAPSLPAISKNLQVASSTSKNLISIYMFGYAFGNFITGFLADAWGRRNLLLLQLFGFILVSLLPVFFQNIDVLLTARLLQGLMIGGVAVITRTVCMDVLPPEKLVRLGTLIGTMWGLGPVLGPIIGGYLQFYFGWTAGFVFFALITSLAFIVVFFIVPETHLTREVLNIQSIKNNFIQVLTHRLFMAFVLLMSVTYSLMIIFSTLGPFLIQAVMGYSPIFFGHLALWLGLVFLASTFICRYLLKKYPQKQLFFVSINGIFILSVVFLLLAYFINNNIILITLVSALMYFACGMIYPMSMGKGLSFFKHIAGTASSIMYLISMMVTCLAAFLSSLVTLHNSIALLWGYSLLMLMTVLIYWRVLRHF